MTEYRVAVVTGASGIGRATVTRLIRDGWRVVVADLNQANGEAVLSEFGADRVDFVHTDVSDEAQVECAVTRSVARFGTLDAIVNNAGVSGAFGPITALETEDWDYTFAVVTRGVFLGTKYAARILKETGRGGSIVNVGSLAGISGGAAPQAYSAAKAAVINFTRSVAVELAPHRIRVNCVSPGWIRTPIMGKGAKFMERLLGNVQPWPVIGEADDVASVITFLIGPDSGFITGESINVDGGVTAAGPRVGDTVGGDPAARGLIGVARGSTGQDSIVRQRIGMQRNRCGTDPCRTEFAEWRVCTGRCVTCVTDVTTSVQCPFSGARDRPSRRGPRQPRGGDNRRSYRHQQEDRSR